MADIQKPDDNGSVLLTIAGAGLSGPSLEIAVAIAASLQSRLHGVFIEDQDLLRAASLPFSREISLTTAEERPTDFDVMQRSLQSMASAFRKSIQQAAQLSKIPWSFDYVSGSSQRDQAIPPARYRFTVVGLGIRSRYIKIPRPVRRVLLIEDHSANLIHALRVVLEKFEAGSVELTVIAAGGESGSENQDLQHYLEQIKSRISIIELDREKLSDLLDTRASGYDCAIIPLQENSVVRGELLDRLRCPLIMVS